MNKPKLLLITISMMLGLIVQCGTDPSPKPVETPISSLPKTTRTTMSGAIAVPGQAYLSEVDAQILIAIMKTSEFKAMTREQRLLFIEQYFQEHLEIYHAGE